MKDDYDSLTHDQRKQALLRMLVAKALTGDRRARRYLGDLLSIAKGRRVPSVDEIRRAAAAD